MGARFASLERWRGVRDAVELNPSTTPFKAAAATCKCRGCVFNGQWSPVCQQATAVAIRAGMPDCDAGFIYIAVEVDPRQMELEVGQQGGATTDANSRAPDQNN